MDLSSAQASKALSSVAIDFGVLALCGACVATAVGCLAYACSFDRAAPTFEERERKKQELRDWVADIHTDYGIYKTKQRVFSEREAVEGRRAQLIEDIERLYDAAVVDGNILYRCNSAEVFVAVPKKYLEQRYGIHIDAETYLFDYARELLPERVTIGTQAGIPGIDPRGHPIREPWVWDQSFARSYIDPDALNLFLSSQCMELLKLVSDEAGKATVTNISFKRVGPTADYCDYVLLKPELTWLRSDLLVPGEPISPDCGYVSLITDVGASCNVQFTRCPLTPETFLTRWPQSLVDATHYYNPLACERFFSYIRARQENWPAWRMNCVFVEHPAA